MPPTHTNHGVSHESGCRSPDPTCGAVQLGAAGSGNGSHLLILSCALTLKRLSSARHDGTSRCMVAMKCCDVETAPKTPPCIWTILIAARWLSSSVAPVQS